MEVPSALLRTLNILGAYVVPGEDILAVLALQETEVQ